MIPKSEILEFATSHNLSPHVIEKDYALGWILAGINQHEIGKTWVFKGGTCLKKCYFETYRFSEDLDFTLSDPSHIDASFLHSAFTDINKWIYEQTGIEFPTDRMIFDIYENPRGVMSCQGRLFYRGPTSPSSPKQMPRIKLDLSMDEVLVEPAILNAVTHSYSDAPKEGIHILCYNYAEVFAEKTRALGERTRPRDLYDVINFYRRPESRSIASAVKNILKEKCTFKVIEMPTYEALAPHQEECAAGWKQQLSHQLQALPPFESFWNELPSFFNWLYSVESKETIPLEHIPAQQDSTVFSSPISLRSHEATSQQLGTMDKIRFAASNHLCIELYYRRQDDLQKTYLIEPYSLNKTSEGNLLLHALKHGTKDIRAFRIDRILSARITDKTFIPSYRINLVPRSNVNTGTLTSLHLPEHRTTSPFSTPRKRTRTQRKTSSLVNTEPKYIYQCPLCQKKFTRKKMDGKLNPHKSKDGWPCSGRTGIYVDTKY